MCWFTQSVLTQKDYRLVILILIQIVILAYLYRHALRDNHRRIIHHTYKPHDEEELATIGTMQSLHQM